jgi:hypothetical protein
MAAGKA